MRRLFKTTVFALLVLLSLNACMKDGEQSYSTQEFGYVTSENGVVYARMASGYLITGPVIAAIAPGRCAFIAYSINSQTERVTISKNVMPYKAAIGREPILIDKAEMIFSDAPEVEDPIMFYDIQLPNPISNFEYFGNNFPFKYSCKIKKGEKPLLKFYASFPSEEKEDKKPIFIDIRIEKTGTPEEGATEKTEEFYTVCDFTAFRHNIPLHAIKGENKKLSFQFRYYVDGQDALFKSPKVYELKAIN